jgi:anthranilate synthase component 1
MNMTPDQFAVLAAQNDTNRIPLMREVLADLDTPLSTYLKLADGPYSYLFESVQGGEKWGRYSIIGLPCRTIIKVTGHEVAVEVDGQVTESVQVDDPLAWIEEFQARYEVAEVEGLPRFTGGLVGYFGYDTIRYIEPKLINCPNPDELGTPDILLMVSDELVVFDNLSGKLYLIVHVDPAEADAYVLGQKRLAALEAQLRTAVPEASNTKPGDEVKEEDFVSGFTEEGFKQAVEKAKEYIVDGDVMQVV